VQRNQTVGRLRGLHLAKRGIQREASLAHGPHGILERLQHGRVHRGVLHAQATRRVDRIGRIEGDGIRSE
jgi:hypothetical protein